MPKALTAIIAIAFVSAATAAASTQAEAGHRGCWAGAGGALIASSGAYAHGRYGKYDFGIRGGCGYEDPPAYYPPPYYEYEPAYDGYPAVVAPAYNPNVYYDYPAYRRVYHRSCCRPYW